MSLKLTIDRIVEDLSWHPEARTHEVRVDKVMTENDALSLVVGSHGDLEIVVVVGEKQIVVSAVVVELDAIRNQADFNVMLLKSQGLLPLSSFGITEIDGRAMYEIQGEMSLFSSFENLVEEILTTADNAIVAGELVAEWRNRN